MNDFALVTIREHPDLGLQLVDWRKPPGQTDTILRPPGSTEKIDLGNLGDINCLEMASLISNNPQAVAAGATRWTEAVKISRVRNLTVTFGDVVGGYEDVLDVTDSHDVSVGFFSAASGGKYVVTAKGGSTNLHIVIMHLRKRGAETDIDLGNWFDYNGRRTSSTYIFAETEDDKPTRVRQLHADRPNFIPKSPTGYDLNARWTHVFYPAMWCLKKLHLQ